VLNLPMQVRMATLGKTRNGEKMLTYQGNYYHFDKDGAEKKI
jgi:hypothetical protein